ncbi:MAG: lactate utilization protein C [Pirellulales bacterium]
MSSKAEILTRLRRQLPQSTPLPDLQQAWISYPDREAQFAEVLASVGGQATFLDRQDQLASTVQGLACLPAASQIVCIVPGLELGNVDLNTLASPRDLASVDVAILPGEFAVAENGAVWVTDRAIKHRVVYAITQHLVLVVPRAELIDHLHAAYERIEFKQAGYGLFISGPSKTADIEQSLVIGAHGARSLNVILVG